MSYFNIGDLIRVRVGGDDEVGLVLEKREVFYDIDTDTPIDQYRIIWVNGEITTILVTGDNQFYVV